MVDAATGDALGGTRDNRVVPPGTTTAQTERIAAYIILNSWMIPVLALHLLVLLPGRVDPDDNPEERRLGPTCRGLGNLDPTAAKHLTQGGGR
jgi:hypothetical protein